MDALSVNHDLRIVGGTNMSNSWDNFSYRGLRIATIGVLIMLLGFVLKLSISKELGFFVGVFGFLIMSVGAVKHIREMFPRK